MTPPVWKRLHKMAGLRFSAARPQRVEKLDTLLDEGLRIASPHKVRLALCVPRQYHPLS